jgi:6-pyruvoyltetrahydropterin/6-carboxytetrahydropterin synthase
MRISKEFTFDSAHFLKEYKGKCERLHGHTYRLRVTIEGAIQKNGMVMDFHKIKTIVESRVLEDLDHHNLNEVIDQPSAENICVWVWDRLKAKIPQLAEVRVWETATSFATYIGQ